MSDSILPKSRTQVDRESFTRDDNGKIARRVTDDLTHDKLDEVIAAIGGGSTLDQKHYYEEVLAVVANIRTEIVSHTAIGDEKLSSCLTAGSNIAMFEITINDQIIAKDYSYWGKFGLNFDFKNGLPLIIGDVVKIYATHSQDDIGDFNATILTLE